MNIINSYIVIASITVLILFVKKEQNYFLVALLALAIINEFLTKFLITKNISYAVNTTIYLFIHNILWLLLLQRICYHRQVIKAALCGYILFGIFNFIAIEGITNFNFYTFIFGAFLYIALFIFESFYQLKQENFLFFLSNDYLLLCSPILFFFGLSFVFGFKSEQLAKTTVIGLLHLYDFIVLFVNIVYYTLIIVYIYREKKLRNAG